ncbi:MAG: hypothetical protein NTW59_02855 [Candidatus Diapherotrites archaeon]|nr:hypothetical protein [Candidatus Diapherotrites archaeon]
MKNSKNRGKKIDAFGIFKKLERRESMNKRGQAALEYLMTYGWALIVIAIVVGVLIFIVSSPAGGVVCSSSDPAKILFKSSNILAGAALTTPASTTAVINIQNATGGAIGTVHVSAATGNFSATGEIISTSTTGTADTDITTVVSGGNMYIMPEYSADIASAATILGSYTFTYNDQFGYAKSAVITCQGKVA